MTRYTIRQRHGWGGGYVWMRWSFSGWDGALVEMFANHCGTVPSTDGVVYPLWGGVEMAMRRDWGGRLMRYDGSRCPGRPLGKRLGDNERDR